jgi:LysR family transcriptional regulator, benzoate and cis,cis-muconate-responsive activator of ben and cat genes
MELRHLRYFVAVAETENVTRAAARLNVSQPPLSRQIRDLEDELGIELFERSAKSLRLTDAGRVFYSEAQAVLLRATQAVQAVKAVAGGESGEIHVGYAPSLTVEILPNTLRRFQEMAPGIKVVLHDLSSGEMLESLRERRVSIALSVEPGAMKAKGLQFTELRKYAVCVAMAPSHPLSTTRAVRIERAAAERLITYSRADYPEYHDWLDGLFASAKVEPQISEQYDSVTSLIAAVEVGRGIALISESLKCLTGPRLVFRKLKPAPEPMRVGVLHRREKLPAAETAFIRAAREVCG